LKRDLVSEHDLVELFNGFTGSPVIEGEILILTPNTYGLALKKKWGTGKFNRNVEVNHQDVSILVITLC
jgi:hypothetical protein